jgi:tubulin---tyrosine ligase
LVGGVHWFNTPMRKFDIRVFGLCQIIDGIHFRGYFYKEGYIRTSSYKYDLQDLEDRDVHLTNDAVQDRNEEYGKYE